MVWEGGVMVWGARQWRLFFAVVLVLSGKQLVSAEGVSPDNPDAGISHLADIVVTARKREEALQSIPDQVTVFSAEQIEDARLGSIDDVFALTPSLHYVNPGNAVEAPLIIRGVGNYGIGDPSVGFFVDGVYLGGATSYFTQALFDIERIEILRGPQSALYGKSTTGGAVNIITRVASDIPQTSIQTLYGEHDRIGLSAVFNGPLIEHSLSGRMSLNYEDFDGYFRNTFNGEPVDDNRQQNFRASLLWKPSNRLSVSPAITLRDQDQHGFAYRRAADERDYEGISLARNEANNVTVDTQGASLKIEYELPAGQFTSISAVNNNDQNFGVDIDYSPAALFFAKQDANVSDYSQEFRLSGNSSLFDSWILGAYFYLQKDDFEQEILAGGPTGAVIVRTTNVNHSRTFSLFGQVDYAFTDDVMVTAGARVDHDQREQSAPTFNKDVDFTNISPKLSVSWFTTDEIMLYSSVALSHRPGGFNDGDLPAYDEEQTTSVEIGFKSSWNDFLLNVAVFYNHIDDQQIFELDLATVNLFTANKGIGETKGIELEGTWQATEHLSFNGGITYTSAKFKEFTAVRPGPTGIASFDFSGNKLQFVPEYEAVLSAQYSRFIGLVLDEPITATGRIDARFGGPKAWDDFNSAFSKDIQVVNTNLTLEGKQWRLNLFVNNVLDEKYFTNFITAFRFPFTGGDSLGARGAPRHWGVSLSLDY